MYKKTRFAFALILIVSTASWAQDREPKPKATPDPNILKGHSQSLVEAALADLPQVQRLDNRIFIQSWIAELLWPQDAARARGLMTEAIAQCVLLAQQVGSTHENDQHVAHSLMSVMSQILNTLAKRDGRLALEFSRQMREVVPLSIQQTFGRNRDWELNMAAQLAATDPQLALQVAKESLEQGVNHHLVNIWQGLNGKDPAAATELFDAVWSKLKTLEDSPEQQRTNVATGFLHNLKSSLQNENQKKNEEEQKRYDLALRQFREAMEWFIAESLKLKPTDFLDDRSYEKRSHLQQLAAFVEDIAKHLPHRAVAVRAKLSEFESAMPSHQRYEKWQKKLDSKRPEEIIALAKQAGPEEREFLVSNALHRAISNTENEAQIRKLIEENVKDPNQRQQMLRQVERQAAQKAFSENKLDVARARLNQIKHPFERAQVLWEWAMQRYSAGDHQAAQTLLEELGTLVGEGFETMMQTDWQLNRATLYAEFEPARASELCTAAIDRLQVIFRARAIVRAYEQGHFNKPQDELPAWELQHQIPHNLTGALVKLTEKNFASVQSVITRWQGVEYRLLTQLAVARDLQQRAGTEMPLNGPIRAGRLHRLTIR